jgi:membrane protein
MISDFLKNLQVVLSGALASFRKNNDLSAASSLAFSATLALIPVLLLFTLLLGVVIGSSSGAMARTQELLLQLIPAYSQDILREVRSIASHRGAIGLLNMLVLLWTMTSLVGDMRKSLGIVFRKKQTHPFLVEILLDVAIGILFLMALTAIAVAGILVALAGRESHPHPALRYIEGAAPFLLITAVVFLLYLVFSDGRRIIHLVTGALATFFLWSAMRPAFHLFLLYNPGYGFAFGSFKSLFVVIIWIHLSFVAFLAGAEIAANLGGMQRSSSGN